MLTNATPGPANHNDDEEENIDPQLHTQQAVVLQLAGFKFVFQSTTRQQEILRLVLTLPFKILLATCVTSVMDAEAHRHPDWPKWEEAIQKELKGLNESGTWRLVKRPPNLNVIDSKWVLKIKKNAAGKIDKYKARLVARGFTQIYGVDYYETYSPVARLASFHLLMAIATQNGWVLDNFDFDQAFLNSTLG